MVDDPPVPLITFRMPPDPCLGSRKIVSRSFRLEGGRVTGTSNAFAAKMFTPLLKKL
jgi:hypothetical protein